MDENLEYLWNQAHGLMAAGDPWGAMDLFRQLVVELYQVVGPNGYQTLEARYDLARCMMATDQWVEATEILKGLAQTLQPRLGHTDLSLGVRHDLATCLANTGDYSSAARMFEHLVPDLARRMGHDDRSVFRARHNLVLDLAESGKTTRALREANSLVSDLESALGSGDYMTLEARQTRKWVMSKIRTRFGF